MPRRTSILGVSGLVALGLLLGWLPARAEQIHRHTFSGRQPALVRGDANVRVEEKEHDISTQSFKSQPSSEHVKLISDAGTGDAAYIHYFYETPPAPVSELLSASVWVKATKPGLQLRARIVFPKEPDPNRPESPLTMLVVGETYDKPRGWQKLSLGNVPALVGKHLPVLQAKTGRAVNTADAYVDRLVLNLYSGPGPLDVWIDDLDIGPVREAEVVPPPAGTVAIPTRLSRPSEASGAKPRQIEYRDQVTVDGQPFFFRAIRHTGTPLVVLRSAGFNSLWLPPDASPQLIEQANREGWLLIPSAPDTVGLGPNPSQVMSRDAGARQAEALIPFMRKFSGGDVLFWDLGGGRTAEQADRVNEVAKVIRDQDPRRPRGADLWDGFQAYSENLDLIGAHRWPLFTSLEFLKYRDWLEQRKRLTAGRATYWTWVQTQLPDWYAVSLTGTAKPETYTEPVGPHPEQIRLLSYLGIACRCQGLGFWSDQSLADSHQGEDRLKQIALLNSELDMLSPVITGASPRDRTQWLDTSDSDVKGALLKGQKGTMLILIWLGPGTQYVPGQGTVQNLKVTVPQTADGNDPWLISPANVECLRHMCKRVPAGIELTIPEFDLVAPIVFTDDLASNGLVVKWQEHVRKYARPAARWAMGLTRVEYEKVRQVHMKLVGMGIEVNGADVLLRETARLYNEAQKNFAAELFHQSCEDATRALRPLRVLMRDHWRLAAGGLDTPSASPYAVSYFSLPQHWELFREVQKTKVSPNVLPYGDFQAQGEVPKAGVRVDAFPGWSARTGTLDPVVVAAGVVPSDLLADVPRPRPALPPIKGNFKPHRTVTPPDEGYLPPMPKLGNGCLKLVVQPKVELTPDNKPAPIVPVLERTFLAVDSPSVKLPPGTLVRVSAWIKILGEIQGAADGVLFYDDVGGEPLAVRISNTRDESGKAYVWKQYHLYRRVPASGRIGLTVAMTGVGIAYFDDLQIEPLIPDSPTPTPSPPTPRPRPDAGTIVARPAGRP